MHDSEAVVSYLRSLGSGGMESQKERNCLARIALWDGLAGFCEELEWEEAKDHRLKTCATNQKPKTKNQKLLLKGMSRAVARDLGLI